MTSNCTIPNQMQYIIERLQNYQNSLHQMTTIEDQLEFMRMQKRLFEEELQRQVPSLRQKKIKHLLEYINIFLFMHEQNTNYIVEPISDIFYNLNIN